jgi:thiol-disulfide isomerase/thioredoxin
MRKFVFSAAVLALMVAPALAGEGKYNKKLAPGDKAPDFSGVQAIDPKTGETISVSLGDIKEDVVVVMFLANHCPVVQASDDRVIDLVKKYNGKNVKFVGVCCTSDTGGAAKSDNLEAIAKRGKDKGFNYVYGYDPAGSIGRSYGATVTPEVFVLDKDRKVQYLGTIDDSPMNEGKVSKTYLADALDSLLAGKEVSVKETPVAGKGCGIQYKR